MTTKWIAINLLLLVLVGITGRQLYVSVQEFKAENDLSKIQPDRSLNQKIAQEPTLPPPLRDIRYNISEFANIPEKNIFSATRTSESSANNTLPSGTMPANQKPILVGIILTEGQKFASILEPRNRSRNSEVQFLRLGDEYSGYTVTGIASDHIVLENGSQKEIITLEDGTQTARRGRRNAAAPQVFSIGGGAATDNIAIRIMSGKGGAPPSQPVPAARTVNPRANNDARNDTVPVSGILPGGGQQAETTPQGSGQQQESTQSSKTQPPTPTQTPGRAQRDPRIIRTPFGDILRPDP